MPTFQQLLFGSELELPISLWSFGVVMSAKKLVRLVLVVRYTRISMGRDNPSAG